MFIKNGVFKITIMNTTIKKLIAGLLLVHFSALANAQNIGIGTTTPRAKLNVVATGAHVIAIEGTNPYVSFYSANDYKGYLWYNSNKIELGTAKQEPVVLAAGYNRVAYFTPQGRVGINTSTPTEALDVNGRVNLGGIAINGNKGARGQVFTTGGPDLNPEWKNMPFANTTRFAARLYSTSATGVPSYTENYNTNTADITISASGITINKTGLYHLDAFLYCRATFSSYIGSSPPSLSIILTNGVDFFIGRGYSFMDDTEEYVGGTSSKLFTGQVKFGYDLYLTAGQILKLDRTMGDYPGPATGVENVGTITGYLISE
jgi:hypothetical protein